MKTQLLSALIFINLIQPPLYSMETSAIEPTSLQNSLYIQQAFPFIANSFYGAMVAVQFYTLWWLKKNNCLFGNKIPRDRENYWTRLFSRTLLPWLITSLACASPIIFNNPSPPPVWLMFLSSSFFLISQINDAHQSCLEHIHWNSFQRNVQLLLPSVGISTQISNHTCPLCHGPVNTDCVSPCNDLQHIYCRACLTNHYQDSLNIVTLVQRTSVILPLIQLQPILRSISLIPLTFLCPQCSRPVDSTQIILTDKRPTAAEVARQCFSPPHSIIHFLPLFIVLLKRVIFD